MEIKVGAKFGRWTVKTELVRIKSNKHAVCVCDCGTEKPVRHEKLLNGSSKSCGCLAIDLLTTHGHTAKSTRKNSHEYWIWNMVVQRCTNPSVKNWNDYGGRGITVCDSWLKFENFFADMGKRPTTLHSLERIDNSLGYSKENCKWATRAEQARNKRNNRMLTIDGETRHLADWCREYGIGHTIVISRINRGWNERDAVTTPVRQGNYNRKQFTADR